MIQLASGQTLSAKAGTNNVINVSIFGDLITTTDDFTPHQALIPSSVGTLYTSTGGQTNIGSMNMVNTTALDVTGIQLYIIGTSTSTNPITNAFTIPASGWAVYSEGKIVIYNSDGLPLSVVSLSTATPQPLGVAAAGTASLASRSDHVHVMPTLNQVTIPTANVSLNSKKITDLADGSSANDAVNFAQLQNAIDGRENKQSCDLGTIAALPTNTYNNGSSGVGATLTGVAFGALVVDGTTVTVGMRILVKNEAATARNGIYVVTTVGAVATLYVLTRATDFDGSGDTIDSGDTTYVTGGSTLTGTTWTVNSPPVVTVGTDTITWTQTAGPGALIGGTGIVITGNTIDAQTDGSTLEIVGDQIREKDGGTTNAKLANMAQATFKGRAAAAGTGVPVDLTATQAKTALAIANTDVSGLGTLSTQNGTFSGTSSGTNTGDQTITLTSDVTGSGTGSFATTIKTSVALAGSPTTTTQTASDNSTKIATTAYVDTADALKVPTARTISTTAPLTGGGDLSANRTFAISAASTSAAGSQSAAQFNTVNNIWYDVTNYGVAIGNSGAANTAAMNTLISTTAGAGASFFFPQTGANYPFNGAILVTKNDQKFVGKGQYSSVLFQGNTTDDLFRVSDSVQNVTFDSLGLWSSVTCSAGAAISTGTVSGTGVSQLYVTNCGFQGFGGTWFNCIVMNGTRGGEVSLIEYCQINSFTNHGINLTGNTTTYNPVSSLVIDNTTMNGQITGTTGAVAGVYIQQCGAVNINDSDIISCTNNLLGNPITSSSCIIASIYMINSFLDHSHGSCLKLGGTQPIVRCKFVSSSFTVSNDAAANYTAFEVSNTATNGPGGIDILNCNIQNTFNNTATTNGILITNGMNIKVNNNNINGFTNNLQATPVTSTTGLLRLDICGNSFGPDTITATTSTNDILLNAGTTATYGLVKIQNNHFNPTNAFGTGSTNAISDSSVIVTTGAKNISGNTGRIANAPPANYAVNTLPITTVTNVDTRGGIFIPAGARPSSGRISIYATNTVASTSTVTVKYGTNNSSADTTVFTPPALTGTAAAGSAHIIVDWELLSSTTLGLTWKFFNGNNAVTGFGNVASVFSSLSTVATISTAANNWLGIYFAESVASIKTIRSVKYEVQSQ